MSLLAPSQTAADFKTAHRIPSLDGLRAVSICLVLVEHAGPSTHLSSALRGRLMAIPGNGSLGVSIFFVISGFLITRLLLPQCRRPRVAALRDFYLRRAFRILPACFSFLFCCWVLRKIGVIHLTRHDLLAAVLFVWNYSHNPGTWWIGHTWSLCVEEQFYLLWPLLILFLGPRRCRWAALFLILLAPLIRIGSFFLLPGLSLFRTHIPVMLHTRMDTLMFGCGAALCYELPAFQRLLQRLFQLRIHWIAIVFLFLFSPYLSFFSEYTERFNIRIDPYLWLCGYTLEGMCIVIMMLWAIEEPASKLGRLLNQPVLVHLGLISYGLYLWQQLFLLPDNPHPYVHGPLQYLQIFPLNLLMALIAAECSYHLIEQPALRLRAKLWPRRATPDVPPVNQITPHTAAA